MKTVLPLAINTVDEAKVFLKALCQNNEQYHPEDDAHDIVWALPADQKPTHNEATHLNRLMDDIYDLPENKGKQGDDLGFCPCGFILEQDPDYVRMHEENS